MAGRTGLWLALAATSVMALGVSTSLQAQTAPAPAPTPGATTPAPAPAPTPAAPATPATPSTAAPAPAQGATQQDSDAQLLEIAPRPSVIVKGQASWDDGYKVIMAALAKARSAALKASLKEAGRPLTAFVDTDDNGFKFEAMIPVEAPTGAVDVGPDARIGTTPGGKAIKFQHRGAYDDVDATYEAITAYLDEKGYDAQNVFAEEYLNDPKGSDDTTLALDIYVFVK